jgi:protein-S-isoprenylcysteine O-methyltransferase Ste14
MVKGLYLSLILLSIVLVFFTIDFWYMSRYDRERETGKGWSWDYTLLILTMTAVIILQPYFFAWLGWTTPLFWGFVIQIIGCLLAVLSFIVHIWARHHLKHFYTERVEIQHRHQVINTGPYAMVRHPIITTFFGLAIGVFLINPSLPTLLMLLYTFWDFFHAAQQEEELLSKTLPEYAAYMEKTPRFLPRIIGKP